jgi:CheY-like chemotaxis protein
MMKFPIVDYNETNANLLPSCLQDEGNCHIKNSGEEALTVIQQAMEAGTP